MHDMRSVGAVVLLAREQKVFICLINDKPRPRICCHPG